MTSEAGGPGSTDGSTDITERLIGVFYSVANELGSGFAESIYRKAMAISLREAGLQVEEEVAIPVWYHGENIGLFRADLIVAGSIILEFKIGEEVSKAFEAQLLNYLRSSRIKLGYVMVFGERAKFRLVVMKNERKRWTATSHPV